MHRKQDTMKQIALSLFFVVLCLALAAPVVAQQPLGPLPVGGTLIPLAGGSPLDAMPSHRPTPLPFRPTIEALPPSVRATQLADPVVWVITVKVVTLYNLPTLAARRIATLPRRTVFQAHDLGNGWLMKADAPYPNTYLQASSVRHP